MSYILLMECSIFAFIFCYIRKHSKVIALLPFIIGTLIVVCCSEGFDFGNMQFRYNQWFSIKDFPIGYQLIMTAAKSMGLSFEGFKLLFAFIVFSALYVFYRKYSVWPALCCAYVAIYPCDSFYGQIRNGFSAIIVIYAIMYYLNHETKKSTILFVIMILLAATIHPSSVIYLGVLPVRKNLDSGKVFIVMVALMFGLAAVFYSGIIIRLAALFISDPRILMWLRIGELRNVIGSLFTMVGHVLWILYFKYVFRLAHNVDEVQISDTHILSNRVIDRIYNMNLISMVMIALYPVSHTYFRIFKYLIFIDVIVIMQAAYLRKSNRKTILVTSVVFFVITYFLSTAVSVKTENIPVFYNSFDWRNLLHLFE